MASQLQSQLKTLRCGVASVVHLLQRCRNLLYWIWGRPIRAPKGHSALRKRASEKPWFEHKSFFFGYFSGGSNSFHPGLGLQLDFQVAVLKITHWDACLQTSFSNPAG